MELLVSNQKEQRVWQVSYVSRKVYVFESLKFIYSRTNDMVEGVCDGEAGVKFSVDNISL